LLPEENIGNAIEHLPAAELIESDRPVVMYDNVRGIVENPNAPSSSPPPQVPVFATGDGKCFVETAKGSKVLCRERQVGGRHPTSFHHVTSCVSGVKGLPPIIPISSEWSLPQLGCMDNSPDYPATRVGIQNLQVAPHEVGADNDVVVDENQHPG